MADNAGEPGDAQLTFKVKSSGERLHTVTISESATVLDLKNKLSEKDYEDIPVDRQRLIYSGRVMKNEDPLSNYKIKQGNTVHLVKSAASNPAPPPASASAQTPQAVPSNMASGTSANNPLAGLTGARFAGHVPLPNQNLFGPDGGMNLPSEDQMADMLENPAIAQSMNEALNNPAFIDFMIQQNPMLRDLPNAREVLQSPYFRNMMTNPEAIRAANRMRRMMSGGQGAGGGFPAPGATDTTPAGAPASAAQGGDNANPNNAANPFAGLNLFGGGMPPFGGAANPQNPFAALFGGQPTAGTPGATAGTLGASTDPAREGATSPSAGAQAQGGNNAPPANPFAALLGLPPMGSGQAGGQAEAGAGGFPQMNPEMMQQAMQALGMGGMGGMGGLGGLGGFGGMGAGSPPPADNRPPEERYADQLRQLNDMGFYDFDQNVAALRRSGGSVQGAIQHLLGD